MAGKDKGKIEKIVKKNPPRTPLYPYDCRVGTKEVLEERRPRLHLFEEPKLERMGELSFSEYSLYLDFRKSVLEQDPRLAKLFPRRNPTREQYKNIMDRYDNFSLDF